MPRHYGVVLQLSRAFSSLTSMDSPTVTQTEINKWLQYMFGWLSILAILNLIRFYLKIQRLQEPKQAPDIESKSCTPQDILNE